MGLERTDSLGGDCGAMRPAAARDRVQAETLGSAGLEAGWRPADGRERKSNAVGQNPHQPHCGGLETAAIDLEAKRSRKGEEDQWFVGDTSKEVEQGEVWTWVKSGCFFRRFVVQSLSGV